MRYIVTAVIGALAVAISGCHANISESKANAEETFKQAGFEVIGYEGYNAGPIVTPSRGGAYVWFTLRRIPSNGVTYHASIQRWGDEYHIYNLSAIDAIKP